jgi:hypothetical protein
LFDVLRGKDAFPGNEGLSDPYPHPHWILPLLTVWSSFHAHQ